MTAPTLQELWEIFNDYLLTGTDDYRFTKEEIERYVAEYGPNIPYLEALNPHLFNNSHDNDSDEDALQEDKFIDMLEIFYYSRSDEENEQFLEQFTDFPEKTTGGESFWGEDSNDGHRVGTLLFNYAKENPSVFRIE